MPAQASQSSDLHVSGVEVVVAGAQVSPEIRTAIVEVKVTETLSLPASAMVRITDPQQQHIDSPSLAIGKELEVKIGAMGERSTQSVFKGEIVAIEPNFSESGCELILRALDKSHRLQRNRSVKAWQQTKASDIVSELCREAGLSGQARATTVQYEFFMRKGETPRELIARFERDYNYRFWLENGQYKFQPAVPTGAPVTLRLRDNLMAFRPRASFAEVSNEVVVRGWDPKTKREITGQQASPQVNATKTSFATNNAQSAFSAAKVFESSRVVENTSEANALAKSLAERKADSIVEAEGTMLGDTKVRAGCKVKVENVGTRFGGEYVVTTATHRYSNRDGYLTHFRVSGASTRTLLDMMRPPERNDWSQNLVVGLVTNNNDPDDMGRVKVKFPALPSGSAGDLESTWARVAVLGAGNARGTFMTPQVNEEVLVGFENGDARRPLVIGSLYNGRDKPGTDLLQSKDGSFAVASDKKVFMTSKEDMVFKSQKAMTIEVQNDQKSTVKGSVDQQISGGVKHKASTSYEIEAGSSVKIKGATMTVEASGSLTVESKGSLSLKGMTVDVQANTALNLKGAIINIG